MIITISGTAGSGKSTVAKEVAKKLNAERIYVGGIRRELAKRKAMTLPQLNEYAKTHPETDVDVDKKVATEALGKEKKGQLVLVEGRTQFYFLPSSVKVFIKVSADEAARRVWKHILEEGKKDRDEGINSLEEAREALLSRDHEDGKRYLQYYGFNHLDESKYDLVIDTTKMTIEEVVQEILEFVEGKK